MPKALHYTTPLAAFRAALTCTPPTLSTKLSSLRLSRDSNDPRRLDESESISSLSGSALRRTRPSTCSGPRRRHRGSIEDATRYYHNAMYGVWSGDLDANRNKARIELIQFLLKQGARAQADSELIALAAVYTARPRLASPGAHLFQQALDYPWSAFYAQYEEASIRSSRKLHRPGGAGETAYLSVTTAVRNVICASAVSANPRRCLNPASFLPPPISSPRQSLSQPRFPMPSAIAA